MLKKERMSLHDVRFKDTIGRLVMKDFQVES